MPAVRLLNGVMLQDALTLFSVYSMLVFHPLPSSSAGHISANSHLAGSACPWLKTCMMHSVVASQMQLEVQRTATRSTTRARTVLMASAKSGLPGAICVV